MTNDFAFFKEHCLEDIEALSTIEEWHMVDLKVQNPTLRLTHSRMTVADGAPYNNQIFVEELQDGRWITVKEYEAR